MLLHDEPSFAGKDYAVVDWAIHWYEDDGVGGSGVIVGRLRDGTYFEDNLGHCSCYGPLEDFPTAATEERIMDIAGFLDVIRRPINESDYDYARWKAIGIAVKTILKARMELDGEKATG